MAEQQIVQQQSISTDVSQPPEAQQIGTVYKEYKSRTRVYSMLGIGLKVLGIALIPYSMLKIVLVHDFDSIKMGTSLVMAGLVVLLVSSYLADMVSRNRGTSIYVGSDGLMRFYKNRADVMRWDQVATVQQNFLQIQQGYLLQAYTLTGRDGSTLKVEKCYQDFKELGKTIEDEATRRLLPEALDMYNAGQPLCFGVIQLDAQGISVREKKGAKTLPWNEFKRYIVDDGVLKIENRAILIWERVPIMQIPNLGVLVALTQEITNRA